MAGILAVLLAGCFNPITVVPPKGTENPLAEPFSVDILIGEAPQSRSIAGPDASRVKGDIRNIIQLIVMDGSGNIAAFDDARRGNDAEEITELRIDSIPFGETYHFLLLMGHWERNYTAEAGDGKYKYTSEPPTLLAAGLKEQRVTGSGKVTVTIWPIVVDTVFGSGIGGTASPAVDTGKPEAASLIPVDWDVTWTIRRGLTGNGLSDLVKAQKIPAPAAGDALLIKNTPQTLVREGTDAGTWGNAALNANIITLSIGAYTSGFQKIGMNGSVNFRLEYVPFNLTAGGTNPWTALDEKSVFDLSGDKTPEWIIRNGVNDLAQNEKTDFDSFHRIVGGVPVNTNANGNGAVRYGIAAKKAADGSTLVVDNGVFVGQSDSETPDITFTTDGYEDEAEVWYAVVPKGETPDISDYTLLDEVPEGDQRETITVPEAGENYDVYVIIFKDGEVSDPLVINTASGGGGVDWVWGVQGFVYIEGGTFWMGSTTGHDNEKPVHSVTVSGFYMGKYEVTQAEWLAVKGAFPGISPSDTYGKGDDYPVYYVSWYDVVDFCNALSAKEGLTPAYTIEGTNVTWNAGASGYRLPTEAEREYAAEGGKNLETYEYSGSDTIGEVAWYGGNSGNKTHPVGEKQANSLGLYDMSGNVWEWCWDWYGAYGSEAQDDPTGASSGTDRVGRGGSWGSDIAVRSATYRGNGYPSRRSGDLGFRLVRPWFKPGSSGIAAILRRSPRKMVTDTIGVHEKRCQSS